MPLTAYSFWDTAPEGTSFIIVFPKKSVIWPDVCCLGGEWKITKITPMYLAEFRKNDPMLVIPVAKNTLIVAAATDVSRDIPYTYHLTRENLRHIIEWAEREGVRPKSITAPKQIEAVSSAS